ncbi:transcriptional regulator [Enterococcus sp. AZ071]
MEIGEKLKNLRIQKNLTQEELGERTDLSKGIHISAGAEPKLALNGNFF